MTDSECVAPFPRGTETREWRVGEPCGYFRTDSVHLSPAECTVENGHCADPAEHHAYRAPGWRQRARRAVRRQLFRIAARIESWAWDIRP
jgi:hypothetical protein